MQTCRTLTKQLPLTKQLLRTITTTHKMSLFWTPRTFHSLSSQPSTPSSHPSSGFSSLFRMLDDFEKYAGSIGHPTDSISLGSFAPKFDVKEREKEYDLQGELPGVPTENVEIEFTDPQTLVIRGHADREHTEGDPSLGKIMSGQDTKKIEGGEHSKKMKSKESSSKKEESDSSSSSGETKYWLSERSYGQFSRVFNFPTAVDQDKVTAKFNNGILDIVVPKMEKKQGGKKITVN
ncbi:putative heat shock protein [Naviculisporaceae sp. PSN 640]